MMGRLTANDAVGERIEGRIKRGANPRFFKKYISIGINLSICGKIDEIQNE